MKKSNVILFLLISFALYFPCSLHAQVPEKSTGKEAKIKWYSFEDAYKLNKKKPKKKGGFASRIEEMQKAQQAKLDANKKKLKK